MHISIDIHLSTGGMFRGLRISLAVFNSCVWRTFPASNSISIDKQGPMKWGWDAPAMPLPDLGGIFKKRTALNHCHFYVNAP